ncbi:MAG: trypsin-like peptidase domain-containing protein [Oscillospiraceae bacterium]|nr:trypsin-like peptidase domain-containing protein [Oscillospiraceae bacterium]
MNEPYENQDNLTPWDSEYRYIPPKKEKKKGWTSGKIVALALSCSLLGGAVGAGGVALSSHIFSRPVEGTQENVSNIFEGNRENAIIDISKIDTTKLMTPAEVYAANVNSTVGITTSITTNFWGYQTTSAASGSGFIFTDDGYILTNFHVVEDSNSITVTLYNGKTHDAKLVGYDESNDVAVLKIEAEDLTPVVLGDSDNLNVGDSVVAIGNPLGELTFSLTSGAISAKDRAITMSGGNTMRLMQTDCAINSGNSGGALFNLYGEVIGITNAKYSSGSSSEASIDNIGFAIPINKARSIAQSIIEKGYVSKPYIGVSVTTVSAETQSYGLPQGAAVKEVVKDSPAEKAGLQVNDIITHVNGKDISDHTELVTLVGNATVGDTLELTVYRKGATKQISITVAEQIQSANQEENTQAQSQIPVYPWGGGR